MRISTPVFIGGPVARANGMAFIAPCDARPSVRGRPAIQVSRRNGCGSKWRAESGHKDSEGGGFLGETIMNPKWRLRIARQGLDVIFRHLYPGDHDEHGAVHGWDSVLKS